VGPELLQYFVIACGGPEAEITVNWFASDFSAYHHFYRVFLELGARAVHPVIRSTTTAVWIADGRVQRLLEMIKQEDLLQMLAFNGVVAGCGAGAAVLGPSTYTDRYHLGLKLLPCAIYAGNSPPIWTPQNVSLIQAEEDTAAVLNDQGDLLQVVGSGRVRQVVQGQEVAA
jgi:peptidase E